MVELVRSVEMLENLPCDNCRLFYLSRKWFDVKAGSVVVYEALDSLHKKILLMEQDLS